VVHSTSLNLYAAVGMAAFIAAGYKTPLTAVVFVAEATGGHSYIIPVLIGAAVAYAVSGEASVSGDQRLHEGLKIAELSRVTVHEVMQKKVVSTEADTPLSDFVHNIGAHYSHTAYPVYDDGRLLGTISLNALSKLSSDDWNTATVRDLTNLEVKRVASSFGLQEALRLLTEEREHHMLLVVSEHGELEGILTKSDILGALHTWGRPNGRPKRD
jgi:chloride channel protein, CIC family